MASRSRLWPTALVCALVLACGVVDPSPPHRQEQGSGGQGAGGTGGQPASCKNSLDCPNGQVCDTGASKCVDCVTVADCPQGNYECAGNQCRLIHVCQSDKDCTPYGMLCNFTTSRCAQCVSTTDCGTSEQCIDGACVVVRTCNSDKDCTPYGMLCNFNKHTCQ